MKRGDGNPIPEAVREIVRERDGATCQRCGTPSGSDLHHRRRRRETAGHAPHCPCNLVSLCRIDHKWVHQNPSEAREEGFIVPSFETSPFEFVVQAFDGPVLYDCAGKSSLALARDIRNTVNTKR